MRIAVLGATGQIGSRVLDAVTAAGHEAVGLARRPPASNDPAVLWRQVDATDAAALTAALEDCDSVVAALGLPYDIDVWERLWPTLTRSVVAAVEPTGGRLVWLDNCYAYGHTNGPVDERTPLAPASRMGAARAASAAVLADAARGGLRLTMARAADFVGRGVDNSVVAWSGIARAARAGRAARLSWIGDPRTLHSYALATEVAAGLLRLAEAESAEGTWHLPALAPVTGLELCAALGRLCGHAVRPSPLPIPLLRLAGWFSPTARAAHDMAYLTAEDFVLDDTRFREAFGWGEPTGLEQVLERELGVGEPA